MIKYFIFNLSIYIYVLFKYNFNLFEKKIKLFQFVSIDQF